MQPGDKLTELKEALERGSIPHEIIAHPPITTVQEGLDYLGITASEGVSTLVFIADGNPVSVIRRDDQKLSFKKNKKALRCQEPGTFKPPGTSKTHGL